MAITFLGRWPGTIDGKRRLTLPAPLRRTLAQVPESPQLVVTVGPSGSLIVMPETTWENFSPDLFRDAVQGDPGAQRLRATMARYGSVCRVDRSGRLTLTEEQMEFAGLAKPGKAIIFGNFNRIEVWEPSRFETVNATTDPTEHDRLAALYFNTVRHAGEKR